jgi:hypothetical protein
MFAIKPFITLTISFHLCLNLRILALMDGWQNKLANNRINMDVAILPQRQLCGALARGGSMTLEINRNLALAKQLFQELNVLIPLSFQDGTNPRPIG